MIIILSRDRDSFVNKVINWFNNNDSFVKISENVHIESETVEISTDLIKLINCNTRFKTGFDFNKTKVLWYNGLPASNNRIIFNQNIESILVDGLLPLEQTKIGNINNILPSNKIKNLAAAANLGFNIPKTLITKKKSAVLKFYQDNKVVGVISKRINEGGILELDGFLYDISKTIDVTTKEISLLPELFGLSLFQIKIKKEYELRIIYVNEEIYSAAIFDYSNSSIDYRKQFEHKNMLRIVPYNLPNFLEIKIRNLMCSLNYTFGSIDLIKSKDSYYFLEINPSGQIDFINDACNFYIDEYIYNSLFKMK